jgi:hypothetical protein
MATSRWANDACMDAMLSKVATSVMLRVCSGASNPADRAGAISATLASVTIDSGDFTLANGSLSGRKVTVAQQANISISVSGDATCVTLDDGTTLLYVTPATTQTLTSGGYVTSPAFSIEVGDPVAP